MEKSSKRGKIPQQDWPSIISRYEAGETLASIARTYDCSPPAISYIVSRTRARSAAAEAAASKASATVEPQLIKAPTSPMPTNGIPADEASHNGALADETFTSTIPVDASGKSERSSGALRPRERGLFPDEPRLPRMEKAQRSSEVNRPAQPYGQGQDEAPAGGHAATTSPVPGLSGGPSQNGEERRTLHLSLQGNGAGAGADSHPPHVQNAAHPAYGSANRGPAARLQGGQSGSGQQPRQASEHALPFGSTPSPLGAARGPAMAPGESHRPRDGGAFIDQALRERIDGDIAAFLAAFDAALDHDTAESRTGLREATDRLLRAGARTRIELERLEARVPLVPRDKDPQTSPLFRPR
jgi:hypothetical protein